MTRRAPLLEADVIGNFRTAMAGAGLRTADKIVADGDINRFHVEGDPANTRNGWYVLYLDSIPAGAFGCWKRGIEITWCSKSESELTSAERADMQARIDKAKRERDERNRIKHEAVAAEAQRMWETATPCDVHPYLTRKGVKSYGLRTGQWMNGNQALLVPVMEDFFKVVSLQAIFPNVNPVIGRDKDFLAGGKKSGCCYTIGQPPAVGDAGAIIQLGEGYATCADAFDATGHFTVVAFDSGNLKAVAYAIRRRWPGAIILLLADNDRWTVPTDEHPHTIENPGVTYARQVQEAIPARVFVAVPEFADLEGKPTDFNDLKQREGIDVVRQQILAALPVTPNADNDNDEDAIIPLDASVTPFGWPHVSDKGQPINTHENLEWMLTEYGITARYNVIKKDVIVDIPGRDYGDDAAANCAMAEINSLCARNRMPKSDTSEYIKLISVKNRFNPAVEFIDSKPWDGRSRLPELYATLQTAPGYDRELMALLVRRWLVSAVAAVMLQKGFWSKGVLVLQGDQSLGKTAWIKSLLPMERRDLIKIGANIDPANKDTISSAIGHWLVELGELDGTFRKADIAKLKAFISQDIDLLRRPYDRLESTYQRRTVFFASVNPKHFLSDDTGNVRWWTIPVIGVNYQHTIDVQQLWAEVAVLFRNGERWWLERSEEAALEGVNNEHAGVDPIAEQIASAFEWETPQLYGGCQMTATEVLVAIGYDKPNKQQATHASKILKDMTGAEPTRKNSGRYFSLPKLKKRQHGGGWHDDGDDTRPF